MGCGVSEAKTIEIQRPMSNITNNTNSFLQGNNNFIIPSKSKEKAENKITPQELINNFNKSNFKNSKGIQLNTMISTLIVINNKHITPQITHIKENYFTALNQIDILKPNQTNSPYSIENNEAYLNLLSNLKQKHSFTINTSLSFKLFQPQIIHNEYSFEIKLRSIARNTYDTYQFNQLDQPIMFLFFDILSHEAMDKIREILEYQKTINSIPTKRFLFLPIMNIFTKETNNDFTIEKNILNLYTIEDCYILTTPINSTFIKLFRLDYIEKNHTVIINVNSEVCYSSYEHVEYLTIEMIEFYLHMRRSTAIKESYTEQVKDFLISTITTKQIYNDLYKQFHSDYHLSISFINVNEMKYPIEINTKHSTKDAKIMKELISHLKEDIQSYNTTCHNVFYSNIVEKNVKYEMMEAFNYLHKLLTIDNSIESTVANYQLITDTMSNNFTLVNRNHLLLFNITKSNQMSFTKILDLFAMNLYNNPQFAKLKVGYALIPQPGIYIKLLIDNCLVMKLYKDKMKQMAYEDHNSLVKYKIKTNVIMVMNPNFVMKDEREKMKVKELMIFMKRYGISFTILIFSYLAMDTQKLRWLNVDELYDDADVSSSNNRNGIDKIFLSSSEIDNYAYMNYYSEDVTVKLFIIDNNTNNNDKGILDAFIDIDLISLEAIKEITQITNNKIEGIKSLKVFAIKSSKHDHNKSKEQLKNILLQKGNNNAFDTNNYASILLKMSYKKQISFTNKASFSSISSKYLSINLSIFYSDYLEAFIPFKSLSIIAQNQSITTSFIKLLTIEITFNSNKSCTICQENIMSSSFYSCLECLGNNEHIYMCEGCYSEVKLMHNKEYEDDQFFNDIIMNSCDLTKSLSRKWSHCHPLVFCYYNKSLEKCRYYTQFYMRYINKRNRTMKRCCFCEEGYVDAETICWNIIVSHMNKGAIGEREEDTEIIFCDECFKGQKYMKNCDKDIDATKNNLLILRLHNSFNKM